MRTRCIYAQVMVQMCLKGWSIRELAEEVGMSYVSMRRKLRGESPVMLEEAFSIRNALEVQMPLDALFEKRVAA